MLSPRVPFDSIFGVGMIVGSLVALCDQKGFPRLSDLDLNTMKEACDVIDENIYGILSKATDMLVGRAPVRETPIDKLHYADAKPLVSDFRERFPWLKETGEEEIRQLMDGLKLRLEDTNITKSKNRELNHHLY